jgi:hypothetical protein
MNKFEVWMAFETSESLEMDAKMSVCVYATDWRSALTEAKNLVNCLNLAKKRYAFDVAAIKLRGGFSPPASRVRKLH